MPPMPIDQSHVQGAVVWITRAEPGASGTAARLKDLGFEPLVAPLLRFRPLPANLDLRPDEALAFTSINGVTRAAALTERRDGPVFAVGDSTAKAAFAAGFADVRSADGDVAALAALILDARPNAVLHPCARETAGDLVGRLTAGGVRARRVPAYETLTVDAPPLALATVLNEGRLAAALFHSPKAARAAAALLRENSAALRRTTAIGLSEACIAPLDQVGFGALLAAPAPTEDALMATLAKALRVSI